MGTDPKNGCEYLRCWYWDGERCTHPGDRCIHRDDSAELRALLAENARLREACRQAKKWIDMGIEEYLPDFAQGPMRTTSDLLESALASTPSTHVLVEREESQEMLDLVRSTLPPASMNMTNEEWAWHLLRRVEGWLGNLLATEAPASGPAETKKEA